jgi:PAP2 superfamily
MKKLNTSILVVLACCLMGQTSLAQNAITDWAGIVAPAIMKVGSSTRPPASSEVLHATINMAVYNATMAIVGGYQQYGAPIASPRGADVRAAVATAAFLTAAARVHSSQVGYLQGQYDTYLATLPDGRAKQDGITVGKAAADAILSLRANDGFGNTVHYDCSSSPLPAGEFEPNGGCGTQPVDQILAQVAPFTTIDPSCFRPGGPNPLTSETYTRDFIETRDYGRADSTIRTPEQTDIAYFWSEHAYAGWNRNLITLAISYRLNIRETARLFALVHTASADALIAGFNAKYFFRFWRPRTAIPRADTDGNPDTDPDPTWTPLLTVNHPEYPSAHAFWTSALTEMVSRYFGTRNVPWTLTTSKTAVPQLIQTTRTYQNLIAMRNEAGDARVWAGLHWRHSLDDGDQIGIGVAKRVYDNYFRPVHRHD